MRGVYSLLWDTVYILYILVRIVGTLGKYDQRRLWKSTCIINPFDLLFKKNHKNLIFHWTKTIENGGKSHYEMFFSNTRWTQLLVPLEILMSKISLKYIPIHIYNCEHSRVIMNMKLSSHGFLFHRNINRRKNKVQIPLIIHHNEKSQMMCRKR